MKVILINESQFKSLIAEESGYVREAKLLTDYLYKKLVKLAYTELAKGIGNNILTKINMAKLKFKRGYSFNVTTDELDKLNFSRYIENINIDLSNDNTSNGAFLSDSIKVNPETDKIATATIEFNVSTILYNSIKNKPYLYSLIQHEITHLYEYCQRYYSGENDMEKLNKRRIQSHHENYEDYHNLQSVLYYCDTLEMNATISQLYTLLEKSKANRNNYKTIYQKSNCYSRLEDINEFIETLKTNNALVKYIQNRVAPTYTRFKLPNPNVKTVNEYRPILVNWFQQRASEYQKRVNKLIGTYLTQTQ